MIREVQSVVLVLLGALLARLSLSGAYLNYVKAGLGRWVLLAGICLLALGLWGAVRDGLLMRDPGGGLDDAEDGHGHHHGGRGPRIAWLLMVPVLTILLVAPPALGAFAAQLAPPTVAAPASSDPLPPLPAGDPVTVDVPDYAIRAVWDDGRTLEGRTVRMVGFVTPTKGGGWHLTRMVISCCAADARPYQIKVLGTPNLPANTWVEVVGTWVPGGGTQTDDAVPLLKVESLRRVPQPKDPYV